MCRFVALQAPKTPSKVKRDNDLLHAAEKYDNTRYVQANMRVLDSWAPKVHSKSEPNVSLLEALKQTTRDNPHPAFHVSCAAAIHSRSKLDMKLMEAVERHEMEILPSH